MRTSRRIVVSSIVGAAAVVALTAGVLYGDQLVRFATHLEGSPGSTVAYEPFPAAAGPEHRIAVLGDIGEPGDRLAATAAAVAELDAAAPYDAVLLLGDNVYPDGDPARLPDVVFGPFAPVLERDTELLAIVGNHDARDDHADAQLAALGMPARWWAHRFGDDVLLVGLDSTDVGNAEQRRFLVDTLAASTERWKIVALHHPPYSAGYQGSSTAARDAFTPIFERFGVQLVLSGHDHDYQRSEAIGGVVYVVTGGAATTRRTGDDDFTATSFSWHHFVDLNVFADRLVVRAVNQDLRVADEASIPFVPPVG